MLAFPDVIQAFSSDRPKAAYSGVRRTVGTVA